MSDRFRRLIKLALYALVAATASWLVNADIQSNRAEAQRWQRLEARLDSLDGEVLRNDRVTGRLWAAARELTLAADQSTRRRVLDSMHARVAADSLADYQDSLVRTAKVAPKPDTLLALGPITVIRRP